MEDKWTWDVGKDLLEVLVVGIIKLCVEYNEGRGRKFQEC